MSSFRFAYHAVVHVFQHEDGKWGSEILHDSHVDNVILGDISEDVNIFASDLEDELPKKEGLYQVWAVVRVSYHRDYYGEWDTDYEPDVLEVRPLSQNETEYFNKMFDEEEKVQFE